MSANAWAFYVTFGASLVIWAAFIAWLLRWLVRDLLSWRPPKGDLTLIHLKSYEDSYLLQKRHRQTCRTCGSRRPCTTWEFLWKDSIHKRGLLRDHLALSQQRV